MLTLVEPPFCLTIAFKHIDFQEKETDGPFFLKKKENSPGKNFNACTTSMTHTNSRYIGYWTRDCKRTKRRA